MHELTISQPAVRKGARGQGPDLQGDDVHNGLNAVLHLRHLDHPGSTIGAHVGRIALRADDNQPPVARLELLNH